MLICHPDTNFDPHKETIKVDFSDFGFLDKKNNFFVDLLKKEFNVVISDKPDLLFFSDTGGSQLHKLYTCKKIFWTGESTIPNYSHADASLSPIYLNDHRHMRLPYYIIGTECNAEDLVRTREETQNILSQERSGCSIVVSNIGKKAKVRTNFFKELSERMSVFSGGKALNNIGGPIRPGGDAKNKFLQKFKFNMAFENKSVPGYATEKLVEAMWSRAVPIYYGDPTIDNDFNPKSFIDISNFSNYGEAIEYILEVDNNEDLYTQYLSEPFFHKNKPNRWFDNEKYLEFIKKTIDTPSQKKMNNRFFGRWIVAKRMHA